MDKCGDGISVGDFQEQCMGGTVLVWVLDPQDVGIAQDIAKALSRSVGLDPEASLMTLAEVAEKGGVLLGSDSGGLLVLCPRGASIRVEAMDFIGALRRAGALGAEAGVRPCPL